MCPAGLHEYREPPGCPIVFDWPHTCRVIGLHWLGLPFPTNNPVTARQALSALVRQRESTRGMPSETAAAASASCACR